MADSIVSRSCCFTGHRPEKIDEPESVVKQWLEEQIDIAIDEGFTDFICGCARGVDLWAGEIVLEKKKENKNIRLIAAMPWPGFSGKMDDGLDCRDLLNRADEVKYVCDHYHKGVFQKRNIWMVDNSSRVIAYYTGLPGGTKNTIKYAEKSGIEVVNYARVR